MKGNLLVKLANKSDLVKDFLGVPKDFKNITNITHNSVHRQVGENQFNGVFIGKRKYKDHMATNQLIRLSAGGVFDFLKKKYGEKALWDEFYDLSFFRPALLKYASTSFNPDANPESTSVDGYIEYFNAGTWSSLRDASSGSASDDSYSRFSIYLQSNNVSNEWRDLKRVITLFDTSSIGSSATVSSANYSVYPTTSKYDDFTSSIGIVSSNPSSNTALANGDYSSLGTTDFATRKTISSITIDSAYISFALNSSGVSAINTSGISKFGIRESHDIDNSAPTWQSYGQSGLDFNSADNSSNEPTLDVTWSSGGTGNMFLLI